MAGGAKKTETNFWKLLKNVVAGANTLGAISLQGDVLQRQKGEFSKRTGSTCLMIRVRLWLRRAPWVAAINCLPVTLAGRIARVSIGYRGRITPPHRPSAAASKMIAIFS